MQEELKLAFNDFVWFIKANQGNTKLDYIEIIKALLKLNLVITQYLQSSKENYDQYADVIQRLARENSLTLSDNQMLPYLRVLDAMVLRKEKEMHTAGPFCYTVFEHIVGMQKCKDAYEKISKNNVEIDRYIDEYIKKEASLESATIDYLLREYFSSILNQQSNSFAYFNQILEFCSTPARIEMLGRKLSKISIKNKKVNSVLFDIDDNDDIRLREGIEALKISFPYHPPEIAKDFQPESTLKKEESKSSSFSFKMGAWFKRLFYKAKPELNEMNEIRHSFQYWFNPARFMRNIYLLSQKFPLKQKGISIVITFESKIKDLLSLSQKELLRIHEVVSSAQFQNLINQTENCNPELDQLKKCMIEFEYQLQKKLKLEYAQIANAPLKNELDKDGLSEISLVVDSEKSSIKLLPKNKEAINKFLHEVSQKQTSVQSRTVYSV